jgi:transmembrane sensor
LAFADGSQAHLEAGAEVRALEQSQKLVRLEQRRGAVRYEVTPNPERPFTISIQSVEVRVIGTIFTVAAEANGVRVSVERGRVAVSSGQRSVELAPGENVRLSFAEPPAPAPAEASSSRPAPAGGSSPPPSSSSSAASLRDEADRARGRGDLAEAERLLSRLIKEHGSSPQAVSATFSLGRIQSARGNFAAAAETFESLRRRSPSGPLAEDALAEAANAWAMAGRTAQARALAAEYESRYPGGPHAERMRRLRAP